jgi:beta-barrel assembly-enhancing protease
MVVRVGALLVNALALNAQNQPNPQPIGRAANFYSIDKEAALGAQLATEFRRQHSTLDSDAARAYIEQMGARLVQALPQQSPFTYRFELTADSTGTFLEPASLPGGYIFVPAGLILAATSEAELAGTLAHAMSHILARHSARQATRGEIDQLATIPLIFMGSVGYGGTPGSGQLLPVGMLQFQRQNESEADLIAVNIASSAGYDPAGLAQYIRRVQQDPPPSQSIAFSPFPPRDQRVQEIEKAIQALPPQTYTASGDFARIQEEVRLALPPPSNTPTAKPTLQR